MNAYSIAQMKQIEQNSDRLGVSYLQLMENAGNACAIEISKIQNKIINQNVVILCGNGNNGGDGFVIARRLYEKGANITVILCKSTPGTQIAFSMYEQVKQLPDIAILDLEMDLKLVLSHLQQANIIVDCIFGTGFRGETFGIIQQLIEQVNQLNALKIAVDIPSGMNGDSGSASSSTFHADYTLALGGYKKAHLMDSSQELCGTIRLLDIGIPKEAYDGLDFDLLPLKLSDLPALLPKRNSYSNKGDYGKLLIIAGSFGMGGAAMMATQAALRCGCGLTMLASSKSVIASCYPQMMEAVTIPLQETETGQIAAANYQLLEEKLQTASACVIGCGMGSHPETRQLIRRLIVASHTPIILDADGINAIAGDINILQTAKCPMILTPHPKEFSRLCGLSVEQIESDRKKAAAQFVKKYNVILVLKGHETLIVLPNGTIYQNTTGNPGLAKGGSGDVLAGMIGSLAAQKSFSPEDAARFAVCAHGACADRIVTRLSEYSMLARDLIEEIPLLFFEIAASRHDHS
jgi:hydroxyethylthiazole kinase-like uncharacterized protein yjeF